MNRGKSATAVERLKLTKFLLENQKDGHLTRTVDELSGKSKEETGVQYSTFTIRKYAKANGIESNGRTKKEKKDRKGVNKPFFAHLKRVVDSIDFRLAMIEAKLGVEKNDVQV